MTSPQSLRPAFALRLSARGVDIYTISYVLGHTDIKTTMVYAKMNPELLQSAVNKLEKDGRMLVDVLPEKGKGQ